MLIPSEEPLQCRGKHVTKLYTVRQGCVVLDGYPQQPPDMSNLKHYTSRKLQRVLDPLTPICSEPTDVKPTDATNPSYPLSLSGSV